MKRWCRAALLSCGLAWFSLGSGSHIAVSHEYVDNIAWTQISDGVPVESAVDIVPTFPKVSDRVLVTVGGIWSDGCIPTQLSYSVDEHVITIDVAIPDLAICGQVFTPWSLTVDLGELPQGDYHIQVEGAVTLSTTVSIAGHLLYIPAVSGVE